MKEERKMKLPALKLPKREEKLTSLMKEMVVLSMDLWSPASI